MSASLRIPELGEACPAWGAQGFDAWGAPLPPSDDRSRSIGLRKVFDRQRGREASGVVLGSGTPARPTAGDLLRRGPSLCERSVLLRDDRGRVVAVGNTRVRELNRRSRPTDPGLSLNALAARQVVNEARAALALGDVFAADAARGGTLPYPHRAGSSPCSGARRPAAVLGDLRAWREGEAFDGWSRSDALRRARELGPGVKRLADAERVGLDVERQCVEVWARWVDRAELGRKGARARDAAEIRKSYATARGTAPRARVLFGPHAGKL